MDFPTKENLAILKVFISALKKNPDWLHHPDMDFFSEYLVSDLECKLPPPFPKSNKNKKSDAESTKQRDVNADKTANEKCDEISESDDDEDMESDFEEVTIDGTIEGDVLDENVEFGDPNIEPSEDDLEKFEVERSEGLSALSSGDFASSVTHFSAAIKFNPNSAVVFAKRGVAFLKMDKPNACIRDCSKALEINPDSAVAYKFRGRAYRLVGKVLEAAKDLRQACTIDFDEQADEWLHELTPLAKKIEEHERSRERRRQEKEDKARRDRLRKAKEAREKAYAEGSAGGDEQNNGTGFGGASPNNMSDLLNDPEMMKIFNDPEVTQAFLDVSSNPANIAKYKDNPRIMSLMAKMMGKMGGGGGGMGMPDFGGATPPPTTTSDSVPNPSFGEKKTDIPNNKTAFTPKAPSCTDDLD